MRYKKIFHTYLLLHLIYITCLDAGLYVYRIYRNLITVCRTIKYNFGSNSKFIHPTLQYGIEYFYDTSTIKSRKQKEIKLLTIRVSWTIIHFMLYIMYIIYTIQMINMFSVYVVPVVLTNKYYFLIFLKRKLVVGSSAAPLSIYYIYKLVLATSPLLYI